MTAPIERPNRRQARWFGKTNRKVVLDNGEVITARQHPGEPADAIVIWKDAASIGTSQGVLTWWEDGKGTTTAQLREKYDDWNYWGRPNSLEVSDGTDS